MAEVDKSTLGEVDLDQAFDGNSKDAKEESKETKPDKDQAVDFDVNEFLRDMDAELRDKPQPEKTEEKVEVKEEPEKKEAQEEAKKESPQTAEDMKAEIERLKTAYSESSKQGKRIPELEKKLAELEPKVKVYDQIVADPTLENMVVDYWQTGKQPSVNVKERLGLSEDFIFDPEDMFKSGTDTNKVYMESVKIATKQEVDERFAQLQKKTEADTKAQRIQSMKNEFVDKYGESALQEVEAYMDNKQLTLEDIYKLKTFGERDKTIARNAATQQSEQVKKNQDRDPSLATKQSAKIETTKERDIMDALKEIDGGGFSL